MRLIQSFTQLGQYALKDTESVTVNVSESNVDSLVWSSPNSQLSITNPTIAGNKTVSRASGGYNISDNNLRVVSKHANATQTTLDTIVWIAHDTPTISISTLPQDYAVVQLLKIIQLR